MSLLPGCCPWRIAASDRASLGNERVWSCRTRPSTAAGSRSAFPLQSEGLCPAEGLVASTMACPPQAVNAPVPKAVDNSGDNWPPLLTTAADSVDNQPAAGDSPVEPENSIVPVTSLTGAISLWTGKIPWRDGTGTGPRPDRDRTVMDQGPQGSRTGTGPAAGRSQLRGILGRPCPAPHRLEGVPRRPRPSRWSGSCAARAGARP